MQSKIGLYISGNPLCKYIIHWQILLSCFKYLSFSGLFSFSIIEKTYKKIMLEGGLKEINKHMKYRLDRFITG